MWTLSYASVSKQKCVWCVCYGVPVQSSILKGGGRRIRTTCSGGGVEKWLRLRVLVALAVGREAGLIPSACMAT